MSHTEQQKPEVANVMAKDFLDIQRGRTYKDLTDVERENLERIAVLARQIIDDHNDYKPEEDVDGMGSC